ncbi:MAG: carboxypeptidase-like regulatory domain-containing protein [Niabella sp.]
MNFFIYREPLLLVTPKEMIYFNTIFTLYYDIFISLCKNRMYKLSLIFILLLSARYSFTQTVISGTVKDAGGRPIIGVTVYINNSSVGTTSKADGSFSLGYSSASPFEIVFSHISYQTKAVSV